MENKEYIEREKYNDAFTLCNEMEEKWKDVVRIVISKFMAKMKKN